MTEQRTRFFREAAVAGLVFLIAAAGGWLYLSYVGGPPMMDFNNAEGQAFLPAAMWAAGHGMSDPVALHFGLNPAPGLKEFLDRAAPDWDPHLMPAKMETQPLDPTDKFVIDRLYIYYTAALAWRLLGFSWAAL